MNVNTRPTRQDRALQDHWRRFVLAAAALGLAMALPAQAVEAQEIEQTSTSMADSETAPQRQPLTRAEVRESLKMARGSGRMTEAGEIGDSAIVLQAREDFNELQAEVRQAQTSRAADRSPLKE